MSEQKPGQVDGFSLEPNTVTPQKKSSSFFDDIVERGKKGINNIKDFVNRSLKEAWRIAKYPLVALVGTTVSVTGETSKTDTDKYHADVSVLGLKVLRLEMEQKGDKESFAFSGPLAKEADKVTDQMITELEKRGKMGEWLRYFQKGKGFRSIESKTSQTESSPQVTPNSSTTKPTEPVKIVFPNRVNKGSER